MAESKLQLEESLNELEAFMQTQTYRNYRFTIKTDIEARETSLCHVVPTSIEDILRTQREYGELGLLKAQLEIFEESRAGLKQKLADLV